MNRITKHKNAKKYSAKLNLLGKIHKAIAPKLEEIILNDNNFDFGRGGWTWGVGGQTTSGKGQMPHVYGTGTIASDLAIENEPRFAFVQIGLENAAVNQKHF